MRMQPKGNCDMETWYYEVVSIDGGSACDGGRSKKQADGGNAADSGSI
jgi:hypothetical protein